MEDENQKIPRVDIELMRYWHGIAYQCPRLLSVASGLAAAAVLGFSGNIFSSSDISVEPLRKITVDHIKYMFYSLAFSIQGQLCSFAVSEKFEYISFKSKTYKIFFFAVIAFSAVSFLLFLYGNTTFVQKLHDYIRHTKIVWV